ncbi:hypothetical protein QR680_014214 [Steinernema hermaphroditum]|uniref:Uncharacterized protein n=1 Tax=Steinernema hermaphroditum TaxID=289476 RepID=A0AA39IAE6_9BILA|nr:hypothetical protein QR680_014214 [Steinernema hermaphroditum]
MNAFALVVFCATLAVFVTATPCKDASNGRVYQPGVSYLMEDCGSLKACLGGQIFTMPYKCVPNSQCGREGAFPMCVCNTGFKKAGDINSPCVVMQLPLGVFLACVLSQVLADELVLVQSLWRHGDRTPQGTYKDDPYQENFWGKKWGELTTKGMWQEFQQGQKLKARYIDDLKFLNSTYDSRDVYVRSTDMPRTLQSAYSNLASFYSDSNNTHPLQKLWPKTWSPIPVHTITRNSDYLLAWDPICPRREQLYDEQQEFKGFVDYIDERKPFIDELTARTGWNMSDLFTLEEFYDTVWIEKLYNLTIPDWITDEKFQKLKSILDIAIDYIYGNAEFGHEENVELIRITGGVLLAEMLQNAHKAIENSTEVKYFAYSAHDSTINALLRALGAKKAVVKERIPDYASLLVLELWKTTQGDHAVRLLFSADAAAPFKTVTRAVSGCPQREFCPLDVFEKRSEKYVSRNIQEECKKKAEKNAVDF